MNNIDNYYTQRVAQSNNLLWQVGKTVNGEIIDDTQLNVIIDTICTALQLNANDLVADFGSGNALITNDIAPTVKTIVGIEKNQALYEQACSHINAANLSLIQADILCDGKEALTINKAYSYEVIQHLSYATTVQFITQLAATIPEGGLLFLGGIPNAHQKWEFYNSPGRKFGLANTLIETGTDPVGTWYMPEFFITLAEKLNLQCDILNQNTDLYTAHYRFDCLLSF